MFYGLIKWWWCELKFNKKKSKTFGLRLKYLKDCLGARNCGQEMLCWLHHSSREKSHSRSGSYLYSPPTPQLPPTHVVKYWDFKYCSILKQTFALLKELWCRHPLLPFPCFAHGCQGWRKNFLVWLQNFNNSDNANQRRQRVKHPKIQKEGVKVRAEELHRRNLPLLPQKNLNFFAFTATVRVAKLQGKNWEALGKRWAMSL